jgi:hypothetical protein
MGTRFGAELPGPHPPQEYVDDLRRSFSLQGIWVRQRFFLSTDRCMSANWRVRLRGGCSEQIDCRWVRLVTAGRRDQAR